MNDADSGYRRLEEQIDWFDRRSQSHQVWYRRLKIVSIGSAALVPLVSGLGDYGMLAGLLGVLVVIMEGLQHINQHHENWIRYRATCESLRHEKYLYLARAAHYDGLGDSAARRRLAAQVESILSYEGREWQKLRRQAEEDASPGQPESDG